MITDDKKWHYLAVKKLSAILRGTSTHEEDFYCLNCFILILQQISLKSTKNFAKIMIIVMQRYLMKNAQ